MTYDSSGSSWATRLIREYSEGYNQLLDYRRTLDHSNDSHNMEHKLVGGMLSDMQYAIDWMRQGRRPVTKRTGHSSDAYRYAQLRDMEMFPSIQLEPEREPDITEEQKKLLVRVLLTLSPRERQCYLLHMAQGMSIGEIANELKFSKAAAQIYINRAKTKVQQAI